METSHIVVIILAVLAAIRMVLRDMARAKHIIKEFQDAEKAKQEMDAYLALQPKFGEPGFVERRGPNRAKNVIRPVFGATVQPAEQAKTGTHG